MIRGLGKKGILAAVVMSVFSMLVIAPASAASETPPPVVDLGPSTSPSGATCRSYSFKVLPSPNAIFRQSVWSQLCRRGALTTQTPLQILLHGGGYNHAYWDSPYHPSTYSYVEAATQHGYATLNIDRLGSGSSGRPVSLTLNFDVAGFVTHQVVTAVRAGRVGPRFEKVVLNGHSMGALAAQNEASRFHDVDGLIVSGIGHNSTAAGPPPSLLDFYPASLDPKFITDLSTLGYLTTLPGRRAHAFIGAGAIEPGMNAVEESIMKDTFSPVELISLILDTSDWSKLTFGIRAPVLYAQGQYDAIWCGGTGDCYTDPQAAKESSYYSPGVSFSRVVIPRGGHSVNSSVSAPQFYDATFSWLTAQDLD